MGKSEQSRKDTFGRVTYNYHCTVKIVWEALYEERTDEKCGMWPAEKTMREVAAQCPKQVGTNRVQCKE
jgi:hypothetical protein